MKKLVVAIDHNIYKVSVRTFPWSEAAIDCFSCGPKVFKYSQKTKNVVNIDIQVKLEHLISFREQSHITETSVISLNGSIKTIKLLHLASKNFKFVWPSLM